MLLLKLQRGTTFATHNNKKSNTTPAFCCTVFMAYLLPIFAPWSVRDAWQSTIYFRLNHLRHCRSSSSAVSVFRFLFRLLFRRSIRHLFFGFTSPSPALKILFIQSIANCGPFESEMQLGITIGTYLTDVRGVCPSTLGYKRGLMMTVIFWKKCQLYGK